MRVRLPTERLHAAGCRSADEFRLHAKRQKALILEAAASQERAKARQMNLAVARQAVLLAVTVVFAIGMLVGLFDAAEWSRTITSR